MGDSKMSKHLGNVIYADDLVNLFGVDAVRYYLLHEIHMITMVQLLGTY